MFEATQCSKCYCSQERKIKFKACQGHPREKVQVARPNRQQRAGKEKTDHDLCDLLLQEQVMTLMNTDLTRFVHERDLQSVHNVVELCQQLCLSGLYKQYHLHQDKLLA